MRWIRRQFKSLQRKLGLKKKPGLPPAPRRYGQTSYLGWLRGRLGMKAVIGFFKATPIRYCTQRDWRKLLIGIPALLALAGVVFVGVAVGRQDHREVAGFYAQRAIQAANEEKNVSKAVMFAEAAVAKNPDRQDYQEILAEMSLANNDSARALSVLKALAPIDRRGYPQAHLKLANYYLRPPFSRENLNLAEKHLILITDAEGSVGTEACCQLGDLLYRTGRLDKAIPVLQRTPSPSGYRVLLADAARRTGDQRMAEWECNGLIKAFGAKLNADPNDVQSRLLMSNCLVIMKDYGQAVKTLDGGIALSPPKPVLDRLFVERANIFFTWVETLDKDPEQNATARFSILELAIAATPTDPRLTAKLAAFVDPKSPEGARARALLEQQVLNGNNVGLAHFVLGTFAWLEKDYDSARTHLELGRKFNPNESLLTNNLAWALTKKEPPDLERALSLMDEVVKKVPNNAEFWHTRGTILFKLKRWKEAVSDLELALNGSKHPDQLNIHGMLAEAYDALGNPRFAKLHKELKQEKVATPMADGPAQKK